MFIYIRRTKPRPHPLLFVFVSPLVPSVRTVTEEVVAEEGGGGGSSGATCDAAGTHVVREGKGFHA